MKGFGMLASEGAFERLLAEQDVRLLDHIEAQLLGADKRSLLDVQQAIRECVGQYTYLEIGSYLGGSIQVHLLDPRCKQNFLIDKRLLGTPDANGEDVLCPQNKPSTRLVPGYLGHPSSS